MMETNNTFALEKRVTNLFLSQGFSDVRIQIETVPGKSNGIIGNISHAKVFADKEGVSQEFDVIIKYAPTDQIFRKTMLVGKMFSREVLYYMKIAPLYDDLQEQMRIPQETRCILPKCYVANDEFKSEIVILEDISKKGYSVMSLQTLDYDHAAIILQTIAKLHALSFIYEDRYPKRFRDLADQCIAITSLPDEEYDETYMSQHGEKVMKQFTDAITDISLRKRFEVSAGNNALLKFKELMGVGKIMTILHGDNWHNNHMFKYKNGRPTEAIPIDFQWSRYGSIGHDFMYLFAFSISGELRRNRFHELVNEYYSGLQRFLALCGYDVNKFCTHKQFKEELKSQAMICVVSYMIGAPFFKYPGLYLPELVSTPAAYMVTEDFKELVNDIVTDWANFGFI